MERIIAFIVILISMVMVATPGLILAWLMERSPKLDRYVWSRLHKLNRLMNKVITNLFK